MVIFVEGHNWKSSTKIGRLENLRKDMLQPWKISVEDKHLIARKTRRNYVDLRVERCAGKAILTEGERMIWLENENWFLE